MLIFFFIRIMYKQLYLYTSYYNDIFHSFFREYYLFVLNASLSENISNYLIIWAIFYHFIWPKSTFIHNRRFNNDIKKQLFALDRVYNFVNTNL